MAKPAKTDRKAVIEEMRKKQKSSDRRRGAVIVAVCAVVAIGIVAAAVVPILLDKRKDSKFDSVALSKIGSAASVCQDVTTKKADGNSQHVPVDTPVDYSTAPPAFGAHWNQAGLAPASFSRKFYTADDRPALEALVHNLEHGYTILWYDDTIANDKTALNEVEAISRKFGGDDFRNKFIAAPWKSSDEDGAKFPDGQHIAFTHWSAGGNGETDTSKQVGAFQYCSAVSGAALSAFMDTYPYTDSPEPTVP
ncbi:hypothetical protein ASC77_12150 [Nocardioides sp. Root1257]|uniref:DUF3105 domain-containing protein n=1 Tax=unclassified Nocardioides TaxID=2615069 RepID=UPI0006F5A429|nr:MULTISPECIES: DUF3105 domain-containing protein [unclassified Nocardioides]KQW49414.1 hypothetical protein ASC77_12150 [Nocardioides sp. Root1257]KRC48588.1 hypothetical protein ASE24_12155 [Nocardioides sp. Root224]